MNKYITKYPCAIIDKVTPTSEEIFKYSFSSNEYNSEWYKNLTNHIDDLLKHGNRNFIFTTTPQSLLAAEYIAQQKNNRLRFRKIKLHILIPYRSYLSFFNINLSNYPNLLKGFTEASILSQQPSKRALQNAVDRLYSISGNILEI